MGPHTKVHCGRPPAERHLVDWLPTIGWSGLRPCGTWTSLRAKSTDSRLRLSASEPLHQVLVVQKVDRNKHVKVRHLEGDNEGMEEFFPSRNVLVLWKRRERFLQNEENLRIIRESSDGVSPVTRDVVQSVFGAAGEHSAFVHGDGHLSADAEAVKRLAARAGLPAMLRDLDTPEGRRPDSPRQSLTVQGHGQCHPGGRISLWCQFSRTRCEVRHECLGGLLSVEAGRH